MFRGPGMYAGMHGRGRRGGGAGRTIDTYIILLFAQLIQQIMQMEHKPPVTIGILIANVAVFFADALPELRILVPPMDRACLNPRAVLKGGQWSRLFWSAWTHADEYHLYYNMASLIWKGVRLERRLGSARFAALTAELLLMSHGLVVFGGWALARAAPRQYRSLYADTCATGFSAVLFAYKVVLNHDDPTTSNIFGFELPTKHAAWAELLLASAFNPRASFFGHLCGIGAGLIHIAVVKGLSQRGSFVSRVAAAARRAAAAAGAALSGPPPPRFAGGGAVGAASRPAVPARQQQPRPQQAPVQQQQQQQQQQRPTPPWPEAPAAAAAVASPPARVTGGVSVALTEDELRQRRLARFQQQQ